MALLPGSLEPGPSDAHSPGSGSPVTNYTLSLLCGVIPAFDSSQVGIGDILPVGTLVPDSSLASETTFPTTLRRVS